MVFEKSEMKELVGDGETDKLKKISDTITGKRRWSLDHELVFQEKATGRFFRCTYSEGATEQQDEGPFEYENGLIPAMEVRPVEKTVTVYEPVS